MQRGTGHGEFGRRAARRGQASSGGVGERWPLGVEARYYRFTVSCKSGCLAAELWSVEWGKRPGKGGTHGAIPGCKLRT